MILNKENIFKLKKEYENNNQYELTAELLEHLKKGNVAINLFEVARNFELGLNGFEQNLLKAYIWYCFSAEQGYSNAQVRIGDFFFDSNEYNFSEAFYKWILYYDLFTNGLIKKFSITEQIDCDDYFEARDWYVLAAEQGNTEGQFKAFECYKRDYPETIEGLKYLALAAINGFSKAIELLEEPDFLFRYRKNAPEIMVTQLYRDIVINGEYEKAIEIGDYYYSGKYFKQDFVEAIRWYTLAADNGNRTAMIRLGDCYYCGSGVDIDIDLANEWYQHSKEIICQDDTLYLHKGNIVCLRNKHDIEQVTAIIHTLDYKTVRLNVSHCKQCNKFFMLYDVYLQYRKVYGVLLGKFKFTSSGIFSDVDIVRKTESPLHICGYNVNQKENLSSDERQAIIAYCIESNTMTKSEILNLLNNLIDYNGQNPNNYYATQKWKQDRLFVLNYNIEKQPQHFIRHIKKYKRNCFEIKT